MDNKYTVATQVPGTGGRNQLQVKVLNRIVSWDDTKGPSYETDPRHVEIIVNQLELNEAKLVITPGAKEEVKTSEDHETSPMIKTQRHIEHR